MFTIYDLMLEYDSAKDKFYLSKNCGDLIATFYGGWALREHLRDNYDFTENQINELINSAF